MKNFKKGILASVLAVAGLLGVSQSAMAGSATATFQVTATVNSACVVSASNVAFGTITPAATGTGAAQTATIYGQLSLNQYLKPDTYTDNLTVILAY